jgi:hypothetical protein
VITCAHHSRGENTVTQMRYVNLPNLLQFAVMALLRAVNYVMTAVFAQVITPHHALLTVIVPELEAHVPQEVVTAVIQAVSRNQVAVMVNYRQTMVNYAMTGIY